MCMSRFHYNRYKRMPFPEIQYVHADCVMTLRPFYLFIEATVDKGTPSAFSTLEIVALSLAPTSPAADARQSALYRRRSGFQHRDARAPALHGTQLRSSRA
jgi:hypothetical protein